MKFVNNKVLINSYPREENISRKKWIKNKKNKIKINKCEVTALLSFFIVERVKNWC